VIFRIAIYRVVVSGVEEIAFPHGLFYFYLFIWNSFLCLFLCFSFCLSTWTFVLFLISWCMWVYLGHHFVGFLVLKTFKPSLKYSISISVPGIAIRTDLYSVQNMDSKLNNEISFTTGVRGSVLLVVNGFTFSKNNIAKSQDNLTWWRCSKYVSCHWIMNIGQD
jgi:hypothetical protein